MIKEEYPFPILVVDDEPAILEVMAVNLERKNYSVFTASTAAEALHLTEKNRYAAVVLDYNLPDMNGTQLLSALKQLDRNLIIIMITAYASIEMAVEAMKAGAFNYLVKPINFDEMILVVENAIEHHRVLTELSDLRKQLDEKYGLDNIVGQSRKMVKVYEKIRMVAESDATVLIRGETGTGKELLAHAIHRHSTRKDRNFVRINCAAIPETLLEAELFGYDKGAFTGAVSQKLGKFERAHNGTICLDEIGDVSLGMQTKLLRILQEGEFDRVGGSKTIKIDTRIIATTNRNLEEAIKDNSFRMDLFYRLNVIPVFVPPLRERKEDIPLLVNHFIEKFSSKNNKEIKGVSPSVLSMLMQYDWPGNVRELENVMERAVVLATKDYIDEMEIPFSQADDVYFNINGSEMDFQSAKKKVVESFETHYLTQLLKKHKGNISAAAREADLDYKNFHSKLKKYQIRRNRYAD